MVLEAKTVQTALHQLWCQLAIGSIYSKEAAAYHPLRRTTFVDVDMGRFGAHYSLVRTAHSIDAQHIGTGAVEHQIYTSLFAEGLLEDFLKTLGIFIVAVS